MTACDPPSTPPFLRLEKIRKRFGDVVANQDVSMDIRAGEIHALLGENGAGKSTLMSILAGRYRPDGGTIRLRGEAVRFRSPARAMAAGIGMVYQKFMLIEPLTVVENILLGTTTGRLRTGIEAAARQVRRLGESYGLQLDPHRRVAELSMGERQRVEIVKLLYRRAQVLIFDEPTAILSPPEIDRLFETMSRLAADGHPIVFITHKLEEVLRTAQRISIMRRGRVTATFQPREVGSRRSLARLMVGREILLNVEKPAVETGETVLEISGFTAPSRGARPAYEQIALRVRRGEILALTGVAGNGQNELAAAIAGLTAAAAGRLRYGKTDYDARGWSRARRRGLAYIPEDRHRTGSVADMNLADNFTLTRVEEFTRGGLLRTRRARNAARRALEEFGVDMGGGLRRPAGHLSGGNLQKLILARECTRRPRLVVAEQPTQGLDVGATEEVWRDLLAQRETAGILLVSGDLREVLALADRIAVMFRGRILHQLAADDPDEVARIGLLMAGVAGEAER